MDGIFSRFNYPYTPQQNVIVERKNKHLIEMTSVYFISPMCLKPIG